MYYTQIYKYIQIYMYKNSLPEIHYEIPLEGVCDLICVTTEVCTGFII